MSKPVPWQTAFMDRICSNGYTRGMIWSKGLTTVMKYTCKSFYKGDDSYSNDWWIYDDWENIKKIKIFSETLKEVNNHCWYIVEITVNL